MNVLSVVLSLACVTTKLCLFLALTNGFSAAAVAVMGVNKITLSEPARRSVTVVVVAFAASVKVPRLFDLPSIKRLTADATSRGVATAGLSLLYPIVIFGPSRLIQRQRLAQIANLR